jgi:hypothetical protein
VTTQHTWRTEQVVSERRVPARLTSLTVAGSSTVATVRLPSGTSRDLALATAPDAALARRLTAGLRRIAWVRIDAAGGRTRCELFGVSRRPFRMGLPLSAALALADHGAPTVVHLPAATVGER